MTVRASQERKRIAATIAVRTRCGADEGELASLRRRLRELQARELYAWSLTVMPSLPDPAELARVTREARRLGRSLAQPSGEAA